MTKGVKRGYHLSLPTFRKIIAAAIEAHDAGAHVLIISKSKKGEAHTVVAGAESTQLLVLWIQRIIG